jgi:LysM repeat protein
MAAKKPKAPKKFKQARKAAVADAKGAFSGKTKAVRRDPMAKVSAEDKAVLSEVKKEAKAGYITDDKGNKVFSKPTETAQERIARDRREAKAAVDRMYAKEDAAAAKTAPAKATAPTATKPATKKPAVTKTAKTKPAAKKPTTATKSMTRAERSAANKAAWAKMTPAERKNWAATRGTTTAKPTTTKPAATTPKVKTGVAAKGELKTAAEVDKYKAAVASGKSKGEAVRIAKGGTSNLPAVVAKKGAGTVATTGAKSAAKKVTAGTVARAIGKGAWKATGGKVGLAITAAGLAAGPIQRKLSEGTKGRTTWDLMNAGTLRPAPKTTADYGRAVPGGLKGKGKAAAAAAGVTAGAAAMKQRSNQPRITGQGKYKNGKAPTINSGGSTTTYKVETGDTLSGIAKKAGVTLAELMAENKKIKDPRKIYRNTTVKIPAKGKTPTPMYTGPVPYVPGSKAAKAYEASRKK